MYVSVAIGTLVVAYVAQQILIPIMGALLLSITISPLVRWLTRHGIPRYLSAFAFVSVVSCLSLMVVITVVTMIGGLMDRAPVYMAEINEKISGIQSPLEETIKPKRAADADQGATAEQKEGSIYAPLWGTLDESQRDKNSESDSVVADQSLWMSMVGAVLGTSLSILAGFFICIVLTFFFILSGDVFLAKLLSLLPNLTGKKEAMTIVREMGSEVSHFLGTWTIINFFVGATVWGCFTALGIPNALLWGLTTMLFNYVPYAGPWILGGLALMMGMLSYDDTVKIILPAGIILLVNVIEGFIVSPMVHGRRLNLNTVSVFLAIIVGGWLWGISGAMMAVPLLVVAYVFCSHVESLQVVALFLDDTAPGLNRGPVSNKGDVSSHATPPVSKPN